LRKFNFLVGNFRTLGVLNFNGQKQQELPYTGGEETLPAKFLLNSFLSKLAPLTNYIKDLVSSFNSASESGM